MLVLGLTGSIGMGKSTTAKMFSEQNVPVHDSDAAVHELYSGPDNALLRRDFSDAFVDGIVDRGALSRVVMADSQAMKRLESIVHPYIGNHRDRFLQTERGRGTPVVVLDIPLLFEIGGDGAVDAVVVVTAAAQEQRRRVLARPGMTEEKFDALLKRQVSDAEKRSRAHFIVCTDRDLDSAREQVGGILRAVAHMQPAEGQTLARNHP